MVTDVTEPFSKGQYFGNFVPETRVTAVTKFAPITNCCVIRLEPFEAHLLENLWDQKPNISNNITASCVNSTVTQIENAENKLLLN